MKKLIGAEALKLRSTRAFNGLTLRHTRAGRNRVGGDRRHQPLPSR
jgi:hypothetical protein